MFSLPMVIQKYKNTIYVKLHLETYQLPDKMSTIVISLPKPVLLTAVCILFCILMFSYWIKCEWFSGFWLWFCFLKVLHHQSHSTVNISRNLKNLEFWFLIWRFGSRGKCQRNQLVSTEATWTYMTLFKHKQKATRKNFIMIFFSRKRNKKLESRFTFIFWEDAKIKNISIMIAGLTDITTCCLKAFHQGRIRTVLNLGWGV